MPTSDRGIASRSVEPEDVGRGGAGGRRRDRSMEMIAGVVWEMVVVGMSDSVGQLGRPSGARGGGTGLGTSS